MSYLQNPSHIVYSCRRLVALTRQPVANQPRSKDGSLELDSRYGCTQPAVRGSDDSGGSTPGPYTCALTYQLEDDAPITLAAMKIGQCLRVVYVVHPRANIPRGSDEPSAQDFY